MGNKLSAPQPNKAKQLILCFVFLYFFFNTFSFVFTCFVSPLVYWSAEPLFGITYSFSSAGNGSGDTTFIYLRTFWFAILALLLTYPLYLLVRRKNLYNESRYLFILMLRIFVAFMMLVYGAAKVFPSQFPAISMLRLTQPYGESSPMGLAWTFMQYSPAYAAFTGFAEILGGVLLLWRGTATFGSIVLVGVIGNVVMMNFCYDIPVKLASLHMLVAVLIIMLSDRKRVLDFVLSRPSVPKADPVQILNPRTRREFKIAATSLKVIFAIGLVGLMAMQFCSASGKVYPLAGSYEVVDRESSYSNFTFDYDRVRVRSDGNNEKMFQTRIDTVKKTVEMMNRNDTVVQKRFSYRMLRDGMLLKSDSTEINLKRKSKSDFLLMNRGFNWINETPFNR